MGTVEIIIVFSALMALIALVTIGIDWIGKPLKHRRFIPRLYRFDDEKLPVDAYGNTNFDAAESPRVGAPPLAYPPMQAPPLPYSAVQGPPVQVPRVPLGAADDPNGHATMPVRAAQPQMTQPQATQPQATPPVLMQPAPGPIAQPATTSSAFSDTVRAANGSSDDDTAFADRSRIAGRSTGAEPPTPASRGPWKLGMEIDTPVDGHKPSLAVKAERFWRSTASTSSDSHFDSTDVERMRSGKAPRRVNPRTGRNEAMQLTGLRRASASDQVRMRWPDEIVDPWNPS